MKTVSNMFLIIITTITFLFASMHRVESIAKSPRIVTKMIHRNSVHSPYQKPGSTSDSLAMDLFVASKARLSFLQEATKNAIVMRPDDYRVPILSGPFIFTVNLSIGTPPTVQLLDMDTGSYFTWVQCQPCKVCKQQKVPLYDPTSSESYVRVECYTEECNFAPGNGCGPESRCTYSTAYADGTKSRGDVATETFTFQTSDDGINTTTAVMGCGNDNPDTTGDTATSGILGLGPRNIVSVATHLGSKFSYCIGNISDTSSEHHYLILGDGAIVEGGPSPLIIANGFYYVSLEEIIIGGLKLDIDPEVFRLKADLSGGVMIDSGASATYLQAIAYEKVKAEVVKILHDIPVKTLTARPGLLCFDGWMVRDLQNFPAVMFRFANGQTLTLGIDSLFYQMNYSTFCLTICETDTTMGVIGVLAQQYHNVAYDIPSSTIHFTRIDCALLDD